MELDDKASKRLMYVFKKDDPKTKLIEELVFNKEFIEKVRKNDNSKILVTKI